MAIALNPSIYNELTRQALNVMALLRNFHPYAKKTQGHCFFTLCLFRNLNDFYYYPLKFLTQTKGL
jgi:hypothetical protein